MAAGNQVAFQNEVAARLPADDGNPQWDDKHPRQVIGPGDT
jgi:hypothetical protein